MRYLIAPTLETAAESEAAASAVNAAPQVAPEQQPAKSLGVVTAAAAPFVKHPRCACDGCLANPPCKQECFWEPQGAWIPEPE